VDSDYTIRTLLHRRLVVELGRSEAPGRPFLYGTGFDFLERFGLTSLDELPPLDVELAARRVDEEADATGSNGVEPEPVASDSNGVEPEPVASDSNGVEPDRAAAEPERGEPDGP
jgi:hypothetical protein